MRVLGIDPGINITGWGIVESKDRDLVLVEYGVVKPDKKQSLPFRLKQVYDGISQVVETYQPQVISIEEAFYSKNAKVALVLGQARAAAILAGINAGLDVAEYSPRKIKQSTAGSGAAAKEQIQFMIKVLLNLEVIPTPADAADALATAICHLNHYQ